MNSSQRGITLSGLIVASFFAIVLALLGFKLITPYVQYFTVQKVFKAIAADAEVQSGEVAP